MNKKFRSTISFTISSIFLALVLIFNNTATAQTKIGTNSNQIKATSLLELESQDKGILIPRLSNTQAGSIISQVDADESNGLLIFNSSLNRFQQFDTSGSGFWRGLSIDDENWLLNGNENITSNMVLGCHDSVSLNLMTDSIIYLKLTAYGTLEPVNTGGSVFIGKNAGKEEGRNSQYNCFIGELAGASTTIGVRNVVNGAFAFSNNTSGNYNSSFGTKSLEKNTTGSTNTAIGNNALNSNTTGNNNATLGHFSMNYNTTGSNNTAIGPASLFRNTTGVSNTAVGSNAMINNTTGKKNVAVGEDAMKGVQNGTENVALGAYSMKEATGGNYSTAVGSSALNELKSGNENSAVGYRSLNRHEIGKFNSAFGANALFYDSSGIENTSIGAYANYSNYTGSKNVAIGVRALHENDSNGNVAIGYEAGYNETGSNKLYIDNSKTNTPLIKGDFNTDELLVNGNLTYTGSLTNVSDYHLKENLSPIEDAVDYLQHIKAYRYEYKQNHKHDILLPRTIQIGLLAQDVEQVYPELVLQHNGYKSIDYVKFVPILLEAIKELNSKVESLEKELLLLKK